jgi:hypothetical protein
LLSPRRLRPSREQQRPRRAPPHFPHPHRRQNRSCGSFNRALLRCSLLRPPTRFRRFRPLWSSSSPSEPSVPLQVIRHTVWTSSPSLARPPSSSSSSPSPQSLRPSSSHRASLLSPLRLRPPRAVLFAVEPMVCSSSIFPFLPVRSAAEFWSPENPPRKVSFFSFVS